MPTSNKPLPSGNAPPLSGEQIFQIVVATADA